MGNYLDREGLGALVLACASYKGGVLIISHNREFCDSVATEKWIMQGGKLRVEGESVGGEEEEQSGNKEQETVTDGAGNIIKVQAKLSAKDLKKAQKDIEKKIKDAKKKGNMSEEEIWELDDRLNEIKEQLAVAA